MSMRIQRKQFVAKIDASSLKAFSAALHLLQKVGRDLILEVEESLMTLRGLNDTKSSFVSIEFDSNFFDEFELLLDRPFTCQLPVKPICMIMKNLKRLQCVIVAGLQNGSEYSLSFQLHLLNGVIRAYHFCYEDCEILNAVCDESDCSHIQLRPKVMGQLLDYIHRSPEILVVAKVNDFSVRSFHQGSDPLLSAAIPSSGPLNERHNRVINTGLSMQVSEFDVYDYHSEEDTESLVFCMKEVAAFVGFCEALDLSVFSFHFSTGGRAIKFGARLEYFRASLIMATIAHTLPTATAATSSSNGEVRRHHHQQQGQEPPANDEALRRPQQAASSSSGRKSDKDSERVAPVDARQSSVQYQPQSGQHDRRDDSDTEAEDDYVAPKLREPPKSDTSRLTSNKRRSAEYEDDGAETEDDSAPAHPTNTITHSTLKAHQAATSHTSRVDDRRSGSDRLNRVPDDTTSVSTTLQRPASTSTSHRARGAVDNREEENDSEVSVQPAKRADSSVAVTKKSRTKGRKRFLESSDEDDEND